MGKGKGKKIAVWKPKARIFLHKNKSDGTPREKGWGVTLKTKKSKSK